MNADLPRRTLLKAGLAVAAVGTVGCSGSGGAGDGAGDLSGVSRGAMTDFRAGQQFTATEDLTFTHMFPEWPEVPYRKGWMVWKEITKRTRVKLEATVVPLSDYTSKRSLLVSAGDAPLLIPLTYVGEESPFTSSGAVLPVSDYVDLMPNFKARIEEWGLQADIERMRQEDGRYYLLPGMFEQRPPDFTLTIRSDIFDQEGIAVPQTWDEVRTALRRLKDRYPDMYPFSDNYQGNSTLNIAAVAFGTRAGWGFGNGMIFDPATDAFVYGPSTPQYKELVSYFHSLIADGLMDPESYTQATELAERKFVTGKSFVTNGNAGNIPLWRRSMDQLLGAGKYKIAKIVQPAGPAGPLMGGGRLWHGFMLSAEARKHPNFVAMLQFVDWLCYDKSAKEFLRWGVEGVTYTKDASGKRKLADGISYLSLNPGAEKDLERDYGFALNCLQDGLTTDLEQSMLSDEEVAFQRQTIATRKPVPDSPPAPLSDAEREQATLLTTPLKDTVDRRTLEFILGRKPLSEWDAFQKELESKGSERYLDMINTARQRYKDKHG